MTLVNDFLKSWQGNLTIGVLGLLLSLTYLLGINKLPPSLNIIRIFDNFADTLFSAGILFVISLWVIFSALRRRKTCLKNSE